MKLSNTYSNIKVRKQRGLNMEYPKNRGEIVDIRLD
jgi:hypothetical protein